MGLFLNLGGHTKQRQRSLLCILLSCPTVWNCTVTDPSCSERLHGTRSWSFFISFLCPFLRTARVGIVGQLSFDRIITSGKYCNKIWHLPYVLVQESFSIAILRLLDHIAVSPDLTFVPIARLCGIVLSAFWGQHWFLYEYENSRLIFLRKAAPAHHLWPDVTEEYLGGGEKMCPV